MVNDLLWRFLFQYPLDPSRSCRCDLVSLNWTIDSSFNLYHGQSINASVENYYHVDDLDWLVQYRAVLYSNLSLGPRRS